MADQLFRKRVILAKIEVTEGTDPTPTGAANAIMIGEPSITPLAGGTADRGLVRQTLGAATVLPVNSHVLVEFPVEIAGAGAAGTAPAYGPLLRACGLAETINAGVDVQYDPVSVDPESVTVYFYADANFHKLLGARGNARIALPPNDVPHLMFAFTGLWVAPANAALPTPTLTAFKDPLPVSKTNTPTFSLHAFAGVMESMEIDLGNQVVHRDRPGSARVLISDRVSTGTVGLQSPALGTKDFFAIAKAGTLGALQVIHGTVAGNIVQVDAPRCSSPNPPTPTPTGCRSSP